MISLVKVMKEEEENLKPEIEGLLDRIKAMSSLAFAKECEKRLTHDYFVTGYISQLKRVIKLLEAGAEPEEAILIVDSCIDIETYITEQLGKEQ